jgi:hypothetical protein
VSASTTERSFAAVVCLALIGSCAGAAVGGVVAQWLELEALVPTLAGTVVGIVAACVTLRRRLAARLPVELDEWAQRRRKLRWLWRASAVLAIANTARLGLFVTDPTQIWASAFPPVAESAEHQCSAAYVRAGELAAHGRSNLWDPAAYEEGTSSEIDGLSPFIADPYEYPPPFTVLPRVAVAATNDYQLIRNVWFGLSAVGFLVAFVVLAVWIRGRAGATSLLLLPSVMLSFPTLFGLQFGQAHLLIVAAAIVAMVQFARGRTLGGAALLAFAIVTKIFPAILLVHLAVRRQWRDIAVTLVAVAGMTVLAALVLGSGAMTAFVSEHVPRMANGEAFAFAENNPDNHSIYGIAFKLGTLGLEAGGRDLASLLAWLWTALVIVLAIRGSRVTSEPARASDAVLWLGLICLATLRSPFAPIYTTIGTLWLLTVAVDVRGWSKALVAIAFILLQGSPPMGGPEATVIASLPGQLISIAVAVLAAWPRTSRA